MDPFLGEIRLFAGNFAPKGWALCQGQLLPLRQNTALFALLGTTYGGDGQTTFGLPNLQGRAPVGPGQGPGTSNYVAGQTGGEFSHALSLPEMPQHTHSINGDGGTAASFDPTNSMVGSGLNRTDFVYAAAGNTVPMSSSAIGAVGNGEPHENQQPYLRLSFIIALAGIFPSRQ